MGQVNNTISNSQLPGFNILSCWSGASGMSGDFGDCSSSGAFVIVQTNQQSAISIRFVEAR
jgi:hypothetical protein